LIDVRQYDFRQGFQNQEMTEQAARVSFHAKLIAAACLCQTLAAASVLAQDGYAVAGLAPQARPAGAPVITVFEKTPAWRATALSGVSKPYPPGLDFLDSQGAWYTPFVHPGMPEPYDVRGWHARQKSVAGVRRESDK